MKTLFASSLLFVALAGAQAMAQAPPGPDNTGANAASQNDSVSASTADGQSNSTSDLKITQRIRKSVMADENLSTYAHNVKIVSVNGAVTLNGVVRTVHEKNVVAMKAQKVVGKDKVTNELTVAPGG